MRLLQVSALVSYKLLIIADHRYLSTTNHTFKHIQRPAPETCRKSQVRTRGGLLKYDPIQTLQECLLFHVQLCCAENWSIKPAGHKPGKYFGSKHVLTAESKCTFMWNTWTEVQVWVCLEWTLDPKTTAQTPNNKSLVGPHWLSPWPLSHNQFHAPSFFFFFYNSPIQQPQ